MMVVVDIVGETKQQIDEWLGDTSSSHHIKSTRKGMIHCPPRTKIRQVQGVVEVRKWGTLLLEVDNTDGKRKMKLQETLIVPNNKVDLFSLYRVVKNGFWPMYVEVVGKCIIKKKIDSGGNTQAATMTVIDVRATLGYRLVENFGEIRQASGVDNYIAKVELDMNLLHRRMENLGNDAMLKLLKGDMVRGIDKLKVEALRGCDFYMQAWEAKSERRHDLFKVRHTRVRNITHHLQAHHMRIQHGK